MDSVSRNYINSVAQEVANEVERATKLHRPMVSGHEGYAVIGEEFDELWDLIKLNPGKMTADERREWRKKMRAEAIQVAAMGVRFIIDVCDKD